MDFFRSSVLFFLLFVTLSESRSLIRPKLNEFRQVNELRCTTWRVAVEANNKNPWKTVPVQCGGYVKEYMTGHGYRGELELMASEAASYAKGLKLGGDGKDSWVFDVDDTLLSTLHYYAEHGYGVEAYNNTLFEKWVEKAIAPAIKPNLELYKKLLGLGIKVFLLTGRSESQRNITVRNLKSAGFANWYKLILRSTAEEGTLAVVYKSAKRSEIVKSGYRIVGSSGDQWSDLLGFPMAARSFKVPNPMYHIS